MALAPEKAKRLVKFPFPFQGLNSTAPSLVLNKGFCPKADIIRFGQGEVSSQPALVPRASTGHLTAVSGAFTQIRADDTAQVYAATQDTFLAYDPTNNTWTDYTFTPVATGSDEDFWSFTDVFGEVFASNGVGSLAWTVDGGTWTDLNAGATPVGYSGRYLASFAGRLVMANTREGSIQHKDRIRWSVAQSPRDFSSDSSTGANDIVDLPGPITGIITMGGRLFIHKRSGITVMIETGLRTPSFGFQTVVDTTGTIAHRTLLNIQGAQVFLGDDNVYVYDGASSPIPIGEPIRKELFANLNWEKAGNSWAIDYPDHHEYHLFIPIGSDQWPTITYIFNYADRTWAKRTIPSTAIISPPLTSLGATAGAYFQITPNSDIWDGVDNTWDTGQDNAKDIWDAPAEVPHLVPFIGQSFGTILAPDETATTIGQTATLETADYDLDSPGDLKTVDRIRVTVRQRNDATLSLSLSVNGGATFTTPTTAAIGAPTGDETSIRTLFFPVTRTTGEFFRLKLTSPSRFSLISWELEVINRAEVR